MRRAKLITALRTAATALSDGTFYYDWASHESCNCGVVACALLGTSAKDLEARLDAVASKRRNRSWTDLVGQHCPVVGMPTEDVFRQLFEAGLTAKDICNLEYLDDPKVLERLTETRPAATHVRSSWFGLRKQVVTVPASESKLEVEYDDEDHVVLYLRAWADLLAEEDAKDVPDTATSHVATSLA